VIPDLHTPPGEGTRPCATPEGSAERWERWQSGVSGFDGGKLPGGVGSVAPLGLGIHNPRPPTADAVGYRLSALRA